MDFSKEKYFYIYDIKSYFHLKTKNTELRTILIYLTELLWLTKNIYNSNIIHKLYLSNKNIKKKHLLFAFAPFHLFFLLYIEQFSIYLCSTGTGGEIALL